jgi:hypothetical protein
MLSTLATSVVIVIRRGVKIASIVPSRDRGRWDTAPGLLDSLRRSHYIRHLDSHTFPIILILFYHLLYAVSRSEDHQEANEQNEYEN